MNASGPVIYVVIVTYNGLRWVDACFASLRSSSVPLRTVVVDNASNDGTPERIAERFPEVHLIRSGENLGFGRANNLGIRYARERGADYLLLLNQDAWIFPDTVGRLLQAEEPACGILSPVHLDGTGERMDRAFREYVFGRERTESDRELLAAFTIPRDVRFVNAAAWLLPRRTIETVGGFDPLFAHYGEDDNYCHRVLHRGMTIRTVPGATICHDRQNTKKPLQTAWVGRYLLMTYADPRHSPWQATRRTLGTQLRLLASLPYLLVKGRHEAARQITRAYRELWRRRREVAASRLADAQPGPRWLENEPDHE